MIRRANRARFALFALFASAVTQLVFAQEPIVRLNSEENEELERVNSGDRRDVNIGEILNSIPRLSSASELPIAVGSISFATPEDSAFVALGVTPGEVTRPTSPQTLAADIFGVAADGDGAGFALSTTPFILFSANSTTLAEYRNDPGIRALSRLQLSAAVVTEESKDVTSLAQAEESMSISSSQASKTSLKASIGVRWTIFDRGDPRMDTTFSDCLLSTDAFPTTSEIDELLEKSENEDVTPQLTAAMQKKLESKEIRAVEKKCRQDASERLWNNSAWDVAIAPVFYTESGDLNDLEYQGIYASSSISYGFEGVSAFEDSAQLIANVSYRNNEPYRRHDVLDATNNSFLPNSAKENTLSVGARFIAGNPNQYYASMEFGYEDKSFHGLPSDIEQPDESGFRYAFGVDYKVSENLWLSVSTGADSVDTEDSEFFSLARLRWSFSEEGALINAFRDSIGGVVASP